MFEAREMAAHFTFCPRCGAADLQQKAPKYFACAACDFRFYLNSAPAAGGIIADDAGRILLIRRANDPGKGKFAIPGGFVDEGETVEETVRREVFEEVGLEVTDLRFLCSFPNRYQFGECIYPVLDFFFVCQAAALVTHADAEEVSAVLWLAPHEINLDEVAFPSVRRALELYRDSL